MTNFEPESAAAGGGAPVDCLIVGYFDGDFNKHARLVRPFRQHNGAYHAVVSNSVSDRGRRVPYMELLNDTFSTMGRPNPDLHVCKLPNLGVAYLSNYLTQHGLRNEIVNFVNDEQSRMATILSRGNVRAVAITTTFYTTPQPVKEVVHMVRNLAPRTTIIVGGPFVFNLCEKGAPGQVESMLKDIGADVYVHESQGEATLVSLVGALRAGDSLETLPNLVLPKAPGGLIRTPRLHENNDMDAYTIDWRRFAPSYFVPTVQLRTARSCAYKCSFCCYPIMAGDLALTSLDVLESQIEYLHECGVQNLVFIDDTFNIPARRFKDICRMLIRRQFGFHWFSYFRAANADPEAIELAAESGCRGVFLGVESGDNQMLVRMNKVAAADKYIAGIRHLNRLGVFTFASMIVGFPGETSASVRNTMDFLREARPSCYRAELYFHSANLPIHAKADEYKLTGSGYGWAHATMDWREATEHIVTMYNEIQDIPVMPEHMFDFWSVPYLLGRGFTISQIDGFLRTAQPFLVRSLSEAPFDPTPYQAAVRQSLADVRLQPLEPLVA